jgi:hypothetical protein
MAHYNSLDIAEAFCVLEWDYNKDGWLRERPSNQRRRESIGVQLHRLKFVARLDLEFDTLSENAQDIYLDQVVKLKLPQSAELQKLIALR